MAPLVAVQPEGRVGVILNEVLGRTRTLIVSAVLQGIVPISVLTVTMYLFGVETVICAVVAPVFQE